MPNWDIRNHVPPAREKYYIPELVYDYSESQIPVIAILFGWLLLGETLNLRQGIAAGMVIFGVVLSNHKRHPQKGYYRGPGKSVPYPINHTPGVFLHWSKRAEYDLAIYQSAKCQDSGASSNSFAELDGFQ